MAVVPEAAITFGSYDLMREWYTCVASTRVAAAAD
jgi:hypothetical protein